MVRQRIKHILFLLLLALAPRAYGGDKESAYSFLNEFIAGWSAKTAGAGVNSFYLVDKSVTDEMEDASFISNDSLQLVGYEESKSVSIKDTRSILQGIKANRDYYFEAGKLKNTTLVPIEKLEQANSSKGWPGIRRSLGIEGTSISYFSVPIFFDNGRKVLFYYSNYCGRLCGEGVLAIYEKVNGKWTQTLILKSWIS
jgi:hypothetical protein